MAIVADQPALLVGLVAIAAAERKVLVARMRIVLRIVFFEAPCGLDDFAHVVATAARAEAFAREIDGRGQLVVGVSREIVAHPMHDLADLLGQKQDRNCKEDYHG